SCYICYPPEQVTSERFQQFWNWITAEYPAVTFTRYTQQYLEELNYTYLYIGTANAVNDVLHNLIFSIRYNIGFDESPVVVRQNIYNAFILTRGFALDPLFVLYQISETTSVPPSVTSDDTDSTISSVYYLPTKI
ncbi:13538_t:CDS:2, partial [Funneliformis geosporum]